MVQSHRISVLAPLGVGVIALVCTIVIYLVPLKATVNLVRRERGRGHVGTWTDLWIFARVVFYASVTHLLAMVFWAVLFMICGEFSDFGTAFYHSAVNYGLLSFKTLGSLAHTTAKAGVIAMTRQLAMEGREHGIRVNSISPGLIETNQTRERLKDPESAAAMLGKTLLRRLGRPEEVANVALFLASEESSYVTGVDIVVDGGMRVW